MRKEFENEIDTCIRALKRLKQSSLISATYNTKFSKPIQDLINRVNYYVDSSEIGKYNYKYPLPQSLGNIKQKLPERVFVIPVTKKKSEMNEYELLKYFQQRRYGLELVRVEWAIEKYGNATPVISITKESNIPVLTILIKE